MSALAFDTYAAVKKLKEAGFTEQQAEAQTTGSLVSCGVTNYNINK